MSTSHGVHYRRAGFFKTFIKVVIVVGDGLFYFMERKKRVFELSKQLQHQLFWLPVGVVYELFKQINLYCTGYIDEIPTHYVCEDGKLWQVNVTIDDIKILYA